MKMVENVLVSTLLNFQPLLPVAVLSFWDNQSHNTLPKTFLPNPLQANILKYNLVGKMVT